MADRTIVQIELNVPGFRPYVAKLAIPESKVNDSWDIEEVAREAHDLLHSAIAEVRIMGNTTPGE